MAMENMGKVVFICLVGSLTLVNGCTVHSRKEFKPDASHPIQSIAILSMENPPVYQLVFARKFERQVVIGGVNVTALKGIGEKIDKTKAPIVFNGQLRSQRFSAAVSLTYYVYHQLLAAGYKVTTLYVKRPGGLHSDYAGIDANGADALLDIAPLHVGYSEYDKGWEPHIKTYARLVSTKTRAVLYDGEIMFGSKQKNQSLWPNAKYLFNDHNALLGNMPLTIEGLNVGSQAIAVHLATLLRQ